jgi:hypothetical protein
VLPKWKFAASYVREQSRSGLMSKRKTDKDAACAAISPTMATETSFFISATTERRGRRTYNGKA